MIDSLFAALVEALGDTLIDVRGVQFDPLLGIPQSFSRRVKCVKGPCVSGENSVRVLGMEVANSLPR